VLCSPQEHRRGRPRTTVALASPFGLGYTLSASGRSANLSETYVLKSIGIKKGKRFNPDAETQDILNGRRK
jgi:hypothetical protein